MTKATDSKRNLHPQRRNRLHSRALHKIFFPAALLISCCLHSFAFAQSSDRGWDLGIAVGAGERSNPLVNGEDIDINAVVDFTWTGRKFFFDNGDFGYTFAERQSY